MINRVAVYLLGYNEFSSSGLSGHGPASPHTTGNWLEVIIITMAVLLKGFNTVSTRKNSRIIQTRQRDESRDAADAVAAGVSRLITNGEHF